MLQETVEKLHETRRELQMEVEVQRKSKKNVEDHNDGLSKELIFLRYVYYKLFTDLFTLNCEY